MKPSLFTKIITGEIPSHKLYEDEHTFAFLDITPITLGHTLVIPKKQVEFVWDLGDEAYRALFATVKRLALHLRAELAVPYVGEQIIGIDVPHAHVHLVPFSTVAEYRHVPDASVPPDHGALAELAKKLQLL